jgi:acyl-CoA thioesterase YciA
MQVRTMPDSSTRAGALLSPASLPEGNELVMRVMPLPADVNANGDIFGGWIMAQVDIAGNQFTFKQPVSIGDLLSFYARVERIGKTSITVNVEVWAERNPASPRLVKVTEANVTYVAIDGGGRPRELPRH